MKNVYSIYSIFVYEDANFLLIKYYLRPLKVTKGNLKISRSEVIQGHIRIFLCQNHSSTLFYGPILMKNCMNADIMKTPFLKIIYDLKCNFYVMEKFCDSFTLRTCELITTLTYIHLDNFCPCLKFILSFPLS